ncbi:eukaryotic translation initiation factor 4 gamma 1-like [Neocloeon triangulifer]|uniref:eukaryotic translation initiation factor 4 gamma 1-like n=1 Tax=Neocloeon triangulifer TaxID=2078957 RepID=UPI00286F9916|nr:eukaryotic translation initiation factor 4 gamma 1-like [Neocloeon triangulifer]
MSRQPRQNSSNMSQQQLRSTPQQPQQQQQPRMAMTNIQIVPSTMNQQQQFAPVYPQYTSLPYSYPINPASYGHPPYVSMVRPASMIQMPMGQQAAHFTTPMSAPNRMLQPRQPQVPPHAKVRSRAIAIVDPSTMQEVNLAGEGNTSSAEEGAGQQLNGDLEAKEQETPTSEEPPLVNGSISEKQEERASPEITPEVERKTETTGAEAPVPPVQVPQPPVETKPFDKKSKPASRQQRAPRNEDSRHKSPAATPEPPVSSKSPEPSSSTVTPHAAPQESHEVPPPEAEEDGGDWQEAKVRTRTSKKKTDSRPVPEKQLERQQPQRRKDFDKKGPKGKASTAGGLKAASEKPAEPPTPQPPAVISYKDRLLGKKEEKKVPEVVQEKKPDPPAKVEEIEIKVEVQTNVESKETVQEELDTVKPVNKEEEIKPEPEVVDVKTQPIEEPEPVENVPVNDVKDVTKEEEKCESKEKVEKLEEVKMKESETPVPVEKEETKCVSPIDMPTEAADDPVQNKEEIQEPASLPSVSVQPEEKEEAVEPETSEPVGKEEKAEAKSENRIPSQKLYRSSSMDNLVYAEDQWSPFNQQGKKKYESDFLKKLQTVPVSLKLPDNVNLPKNILREANRSSRPVGGGFQFSNENNLMPAFASSSSPRRDPRIIKSISLYADVKLNETENAWKPSTRKQSDEDDASEKEELLKKVRSILNKITPEKFDKLMGQVKEMKIDTMEKLDGVINLIFLKAIDEPSFSHVYAKMCHELSCYVKLRTELEGQETLVSFKKLLITRCQQEFEKQNKNEVEDKKKEEMVKKIEEATGDSKKELEMELAEMERKKRVRYVGVNRFIAELYQRSLLTDAIMLRCILELLSDRGEESLECMCKILTTIGKDLTDKGVELKEPFAQIKQLVDKKVTSTRIRFMMQDVVELRDSGWKPRREAAKPKTMEEIAQEAKKEAAAVPPPSPMPQSNLRTPSRGQDRPNDKFSRSTPRPPKPVNTPFDAKKLTGGLVKDQEFNLGRPMSFNKWTSGSGGGMLSGSGVPKTKNPFMVLGDSDQSSDTDLPNDNPSQTKQLPRV